MYTLTITTILHNFTNQLQQFEGGREGGGVLSMAAVQHTITLLFREYLLQIFCVVNCATRVELISDLDIPYTVIREIFVVKKFP